MKEANSQRTDPVVEHDFSWSSFSGRQPYAIGKVVNVENHIGQREYQLVSYETSYKGQPAWITIHYNQLDKSMLDCLYQAGVIQDEGLEHDNPESVKEFLAKVEVGLNQKLSDKIQFYKFGYPENLSSMCRSPVLPLIYDTGRILEIERDGEGKAEGVGVCVYTVTEPLYDELEAPMQIDAALQLVLNLAKGLKPLHEEGTYHLRINPRTVIGSVDNPKLINFYDPGELQLSQSLQSMGAIFDMVIVSSCPREIIKAEMISPRSDVYGLGNILHYALSGDTLVGVNGDFRQVIDRVYDEKRTFKRPSLKERVFDSKARQVRKLIDRSTRRLEKRMDLDGFIGELEGIVK